MIFQRTELLIGKENLEKLNKSHVLIFGVGGVGGYVVEALVRAGIGEITVVDFDTIDITNINRQIIATSDNIGKSKVEILKKRAISINPKIKINEYKEMFKDENSELFFNNKKNYSYVVDAIDLVTHKIKIITCSKEFKVPIISSMGTGNKLNPLDFKVADISKTSVCPLARVMRKELKKRGITHVKVVYSEENPRKPEKKLEETREKTATVGSISFVPSVAGLIIASEVIKDICGIKN